jgi:GntR family transcriptional regulator, transcriptional repressor for pyruvate dehydrogenase complex
LDMVVEALRDYIIQNQLGVGDRLPPEYDLSSSLGVSRNILREGMRFFRTLGIIESKPRLGAVIKSLHPENPFGGYLPFMGRDQRSHREIMETRIVLEVGAAPLLIKHCTAEDIADLKTILLNFIDDCDILKQADIAFHRRLMAITHNRVLESLTPLTVEFFELNNHKYKAVNRSVSEIIRQHEEIIAALESGRVERLAVAIDKHYKSYRERKANA